MGDAGPTQCRGKAVGECHRALTSFAGLTIRLVWISAAFRSSVSGPGAVLTTGAR
jgi:hypothetical protein